MSDDKKSFVASIKGKSLQEIATSTLGWAWVTYALPYLIGGGIVSWLTLLSNLDPLQKAAYAILLACGVVYLARIMRGTVPLSINTMTVAELRHKKKETDIGNVAKDKFMISLSSGSLFSRQVTKEINGKNYNVVMCKVWNVSENTTLREIRVGIQMATWGGNVLPTRRSSPQRLVDIGPAPPSLHPGQSVEFILTSIDQATNNALIYAGSPENCSEECTAPSGTWHFITVYVSAADSKSQVENFVFVSASNGQLFSIDNDPRKWGHGDNAPHPFFG
ncbi:MAG: hypothetical protein JSS20_18770 [Proteobacteria bacterium]|nr:hypothetical protein [Pseudomonadota bacterium]